jgi:hypothetical protein
VSRKLSTRFWGYVRPRDQKRTQNFRIIQGGLPSIAGASTAAGWAAALALDLAELGELGVAPAASFKPGS